MSRLNSLSAAAIKTLYSADADDTLITLITLYDPANDTQPVVRIADNYTTHFTSPVKIGNPALTPPRIVSAPTGAAAFPPIELQTDGEDIIYGVIGPSSEKFIFLPLSITLPDETAGQSPRCTLTFFDIAGYLTPLIREIYGPPLVKIELVLASNPSIVEISFSDFFLTNISYSRESIQANLNVINLDREPFPQHQFTPAYFPGLF
jgi:hypothetical protein